jgi:hypothetical protein
MGDRGCGKSFGGMMIASSEDTVVRSGTENTESFIYFWQGSTERAEGMHAPAHAKNRPQCNREVKLVQEAL